MIPSDTLAIILAAGKGSRMRMDRPKPLVTVYERPIVSWIIDDFKKNSVSIALVINPKDQYLFKKYSEDVIFVYQEKQYGTGHAVMQASSLFKEYKYIYVFVGDCPFVGKDNIKRMYDVHTQKNNDCTILSSMFQEKTFPYARIVRNQRGKFLYCVEEIDANKKEKDIKELFCSQYLFRSHILSEYIHRLSPNANNGEIYFTDILNKLIQHENKVSTLVVDDWKRLVGLNKDEDLRWIESQKMI